MRDAVITLVAALLAYGLGPISFAIVVSRLMRLPDPRSYGSKNPGATNVLRTGRKVAAALTLLGDAGKGWLAVWLAWYFTVDMTVAAIGSTASAAPSGRSNRMAPRLRAPWKGMTTRLRVGW